jgi:hypothetical protein
MAFTIPVNGTRHSVDIDARHDRAGLLTRAKIFALTAVMCLSGVQAMAADGLTTIRSSLGSKDTMSRLARFVRTGRLLDDQKTHSAGSVRAELILSAVLALLVAGFSAVLVLI